MKRSYVQVLGAMAVLLAAALLLPAGRAAAHAAYDHSTPAENEVVPTAPSQVDVYFKQDVFKVAGKFYVRVFADDATTQVSTGDGVVDDNDRKHITATVTSTLPDGRYIVRWMNTSDEDGDEAEGAFCFYVNVQPSADQSTECAALEATPTVETTAVTTGTPSTAEPATVTTPEASPTVAPAGGGGGGSNTGVIVGVIVGVVVVVVVVIGGGALYLRRPRA